MRFHLTAEATAHGFAYAVPATFSGIVGDGRGERSQAPANQLIWDLDPTSLPGSRPRDHGRRQATASFGADRMTRRQILPRISSDVLDVSDRAE